MHCSFWVFIGGEADGIEQDAGDNKVIEGFGLGYSKANAVEFVFLCAQVHFVFLDDIVGYVGDITDIGLVIEILGDSLLQQL